MTIIMKLQFPESVYRDHFSSYMHGVIEYRLPSGMIADIMTNEYVIEVDPVNKCAEAIGQSLLYAMESKKRPCICFIYDSVNDWRYMQLIMPLLNRLCITVYTIDIYTRTILLRAV